MAFTLRSELGEATARLMMRAGEDYNKRIVVLTAQKTLTFAGVVDVINSMTGRQLQVELVSPNEFVRLKSTDGEGGEPETFFRFVLSWYESVSSGDAGFTHPFMAEVLGREPTPTEEAIRGGGGGGGFWLTIQIMSGIRIMRIVVSTSLGMGLGSV
ncbi:hypothetical protein N7466_006191 [Penicillium verhagenii]|uniref:uncharacterized protein n=1 Tax=Penicillium verhagenii TaxID=1562060 RepID=UPI002545A513|nr:uncharacterized protein N7466_006191 [Penicillium verhagenii]KAJ5930698.1 hypothetical protein N7466_006191 [Penicillium verhagenii]